MRPVDQSLSEAIARLWKWVSRRRKMQFYVLVVSMILASVAEVCSLGMIVPFLAALTTPNLILDNGALQQVIALAPWITRTNIAFWLAAVFCIVTLLAAGFRLLLLYASTRFAFALGADLSLELYRRTLYQPYAVHIGRNSSEVINGVINKSHIITNSVVSQLLVVGSSSFLILGILAALVAISPSITVAAVAAFALIYGAVMFFSRRRLAIDSSVFARETTQVQKALQEGLGGIRDVLLDNTQELFSEMYRVSDRRVRTVRGRQIIMASSPRFVVEGLGMIAIALLAVVASDGGSDASVVPVLGALALGSQRLLPVVQQLYAATVAIRSSQASLWDTLRLLEQPVRADAGKPAITLPFVNSIELRDVSFRYSPELPFALHGINLRIAKGERLGIFGPTGGGKSTLLDILMGLLSPTSGVLAIDGTATDDASLRGWQRHIAHVPQSIHLSDASVAENIAFGQPSGSIDMARVREAARVAQLLRTIEQLPAGFATVVGERGVRLSGGQRQRLGIARALYKQADVIVFDEATSALDSQTEEELIASISALSHDFTIIMVAHRLSTLSGCDRVVEVAEGRIAGVGTYDTLIR